MFVFAQGSQSCALVTQGLKTVFLRILLNFIVIYSRRVSPIPDTPLWLETDFPVIYNFKTNRIQNYVHNKVTFRFLNFNMNFE